MAVINPPEKKLAKRTSVQCVDLADRLTDMLATAISYVTLVLLRKYPKYVHQVLGEHEFILHEFH